MNEPIWRELSVIDNCCGHLDIGNLAAVRAATSLAPTYLRELPKVRNFAAHKCENTRLQLDKIALARGQPSNANLATVMLATGNAGIPTVALQWMVEMEAALVAMCG
jgi:hypothetical protein